jgi:hypothetical protein
MRKMRQETKSEPEKSNPSKEIEKEEAENLDWDVLESEFDAEIEKPAPIVKKPGKSLF